MQLTKCLRHMVGFLFVALLLGCTSAVPAPIEPSPTSPPPTTPVNTSRPTSAPMPTPATFVRQPTFTPIPTPTSFTLSGPMGESYGPTNFPEGMNPLTGLMVEDPSLLERRPMAIKVTNFPRQVRPQWGLSKADHIYEYYLEDGLTRFVGIFYGQDATRVGPIRSARPIDYHLVTAYKAIFAFGYADKKVYDPLKATEISDFLVIERPGNCPPMCRIGPDSDWNTLYTDTSQLSQYITDKGIDNSRQDLDGLRFSGDPLRGNNLVDSVTIRYSRTSHHKWEYNPARNTYMRSQEIESNDIGEEVYAPLYDNLTKRWLWADNLVILLVPTDFFYKSNSTEIYDIQLKREGPGYALRDGKIFTIKWHRPTPESTITLTFTNGNNFPLRPGNVWFEVLSHLTTHEIKEGNAWYFYFDLPER